MSDEILISADSARRPSLRERAIGSHYFMAIVSPLLLLVLWEIVARANIIDTRFFPSPSSVLAEMWDVTISGELPVNVGWTVQRVAIGFVLGAVPAVLLGLVMGLSPALNALLRPTIAAVYPIPKIALFPLVMMIFGLGEPSKWAIVGVAVFFQVFFSTLAGVLHIERIYLDVAANFGATRWQAYRTIALPAALPFIFSGFQLGLGMALIVVVVAEQFGAKTGLGYMIWRSWQIFEVRDMFVALTAIALLGYGSQLALAALERRLVGWKARDDSRAMV